MVRMEPVKGELGGWKRSVTVSLCSGPKFAFRVLEQVGETLLRHTQSLLAVRAWALILVF